VSGCGGEPPAIGDPGIISPVRDLVAGGGCEAATDLSQGGLLAALAALSPSAAVDLGLDELTELFSESSGRFLLAAKDESLLKGLPYRIIGEAGGDGLRIRCGTQKLAIGPEELEHALSSLTRAMRS
jgi:phosphoribosylformylglycinamidine synthase